MVYTSRTTNEFSESIFSPSHQFEPSQSMEIKQLDSSLIKQLHQFEGGPQLNRGQVDFQFQRVPNKVYYESIEDFVLIEKMKQFQRETELVDCS